jgi:hypothetical protein
VAKQNRAQWANFRIVAQWVIFRIERKIRQIGGIKGRSPRVYLTGGQRAKIKNYSHDNLLKETELKAALTGSTKKH